MFLPLEEGLRKSLLVQINQSKLYSGHVVLVVSDTVLPGLQGLIDHVLVLLDEGSEELSPVLLLRHFGQISFLALEFLSGFDFVFKLHPCHFKLFIDFVEPDEIKTSFHKHPSSCAFNLLHQELFLLEVFSISRVLTPTFPSFELDDLSISLRVHYCQLHRQEDLLLEPHVGDQVTHLIITLL